MEGELLYRQTNRPVVLRPSESVCYCHVVRREICLCAVNVSFIGREPYAFCVARSFCRKLASI